MVSLGHNELTVNVAYLIFTALLSLDSKVHGANMESIWGRQDPGGPYIGPMNFAIWVSILEKINLLQWVCTVYIPFKYDCFSANFWDMSSLWADFQSCFPFGLIFRHVW